MSQLRYITAQSTTVSSSLSLYSDELFLKNCRTYSGDKKQLHIFFEWKTEIDFAETNSFSKSYATLFSFQFNLFHLSFI